MSNFSNSHESSAALEALRKEGCLTDAELTWNDKWLFGQDGKDIGAFQRLCCFLSQFDLLEVKTKYGPLEVRVTNVALNALGSDEVFAAYGESGRKPTSYVRVYFHGLMETVWVEHLATPPEEFFLE